MSEWLQTAIYAFGALLWLSWIAITLGYVATAIAESAKPELEEEWEDDEARGRETEAR